MTTATATSSSDLSEQAAQMIGLHQRLRAGLARRVVGQDQVIDQLIIALFSGGHALLEGVPGLAKTLMLRSLAELLGLSFSRIQFTPDLMPSDITGTEVIAEDRSSINAQGGTRPPSAQRSEFAGLHTPAVAPLAQGSTMGRGLRFLPGPIFASFVLADEINRTPPKTQAALMEAMEERQVTAAGRRHALPEPFFVLATQNPIEQDGTYPLPAAQLDRFMFLLRLDYPSPAEEEAIARLVAHPDEAPLDPVLERPELLQAMTAVRGVAVDDAVLAYALGLARATRAHVAGATARAREWLAWGAGPRAGQMLVRGAQARALLTGRTRAEAADVRALALSVLGHRLVLNFHATAERIPASAVVEDLLAQIPAPDGWRPAVRRVRPAGPWRRLLHTLRGRE